MNEDLIRAHAFARRMRSRLCTDALPFPGGVAYLDRDFPLRYDSNLLWVDDPETRRPRTGSRRPSASSASAATAIAR